MPRSKPWLKLWTEWVHDAKILKLSLAERGAWCLIMTLAQECNAEGKLVTGNGTSLTIEDMAQSLHLYKKADIDTFRSMIGKMESEGSLAWNGNCLSIVHFADRQELAPSDTPEAIRERVRRYREKKAGVTEKPLQTELPLSPHIAILSEELQHIPPSVDRLVQHESIKQVVADIGKANGFVVQSEYPTNLGRIDLCWLKENKIIFAFEIDYLTPKEKSLEKLQLLSCPEAYIILREPYIHLERAEKREAEKRTIGNIPIEGEEEGEGNGVTSVTQIKKFNISKSVGNEKSVTVSQKKEKKVEKKPYFSNVFLTKEEYEKLVEQFGPVGTNERIEALSLYIKSKGAEHKYKDHYATILNWERMGKQKGGKAGQQLPTTKELKEGWKQ